ncbi:hypothetical protein FA13DRAFT_1796554 [Coprinellus micaceus]|uniref:Uncharacterized protein n=1 Tax=Coprinellus micaceus TaxID=71717 RepID=A0A4Y7SU79_COPMI|nr:hypothetical protein FA13DRAFT_1796554 [Coprinellus micaceus]
MSTPKHSNITAARLHQVLRRLGVIVRSGEEFNETFSEEAMSSVAIVAVLARALNEMGLHDACLDDFSDRLRSILHPPPAQATDRDNLSQGYESDTEGSTTSENKSDRSNDDSFHDAETDLPRSSEAEDSEPSSTQRHKGGLGLLMDDPSLANPSEPDVQREEVFFTGGTPDYCDPYYTDTDNNAQLPFDIIDTLSDNAFDLGRSSRYPESSEEDEGSDNADEQQVLEPDTEEAFFTGPSAIQRAGL